MKNTLIDKIVAEGSLAEELVKTEGYQYIAKTMAEKESYCSKKH